MALADLTRLPTSLDICVRYSFSEPTLRRWMLAGLIPRPLRSGARRVWPADVFQTIDANLKAQSGTTQATER